MCTDGSAAIGAVHGQGLGKTRHVEVQFLWSQKDVFEGKLGVVKVGTDIRPVDLMRKYLRAEVADAHLETLRYYTSTGRAASAPVLLACSRAADDDRWEPCGRSAVVTRHHMKLRFAMFTLIKFARGPKNAAAVGSLRVTVGELADGQSFCRIDDC